MAARLLQLLALWSAVLGVARCCPELCSCQDKFNHQFADCAYKDLLVVPVGLPTNVTTVILSANKIKSLKSRSFVNISQVTSLWLAHNEIVSIETGTLAPLVQLRNLDISHNKIVNFPWEDLHNLTVLQLLKMNNNEMVNLPKDAFSTLKDLRSLRINNNMFATIVQGTFSALTAMSYLQIFNNPFTCSCKLEWLRDWIAKTKISVPDANSIVCDAPEQLRGTLVSKMPKLECKAPTVVISSQPNLETSELSEGVMVTLTCETKGSPKPLLSWEVIAGNENFLFPLPSTVETSDMPVNAKTTRTRFLVFGNGTLVILRLSKREDGNYTCSAINDLGRAESSVRLTVAVNKKHGGGNSGAAAPAKNLIPTINQYQEPKTPDNNVINSA